MAKYKSRSVSERAYTPEFFARFDKRKENEFGNRTSIDDEYRYIKTLHGEIFGVGLYPRSTDDPGVMFAILHEDDGHWFTSENGSSAWWLADCARVMAAAQGWIETYCARGEKGEYKFTDAMMQQLHEDKIKRIESMTLAINSIIKRSMGSSSY